MAIVNSFCFCWSLKHGTIVAGVISLIRAVFILVIGSIIWDMFHTRYVDRGENRLRSILLMGAMGLLIFGITHILVTGLLFTGVYKEKPCCLIPWVVYQIFEFVVSILVFGFIFSPGIWDMRVASSFFVGWAMIYFVIVVLAYYKLLKNPPNSQLSVHYTPSTQPLVPD